MKSCLGSVACVRGPVAEASNTQSRVCSYHPHNYTCRVTNTVTVSWQSTHSSCCASHKCVGTGHSSTKRITHIGHSVTLMHARQGARTHCCNASDSDNVLSITLQMTHHRCWQPTQSQQTLPAARNTQPGVLLTQSGCWSRSWYKGRTRSAPTQQPARRWMSNTSSLNSAGPA